MLAYMLAYMVPYEGVQIKFKLYFPLGNGAEGGSSRYGGVPHDGANTPSSGGPPLRPAGSLASENLPRPRPGRPGTQYSKIASDSESQTKQNRKLVSESQQNRRNRSNRRSQENRVILESQIASRIADRKRIA
jgi:hypothetical protein